MIGTAFGTALGTTSGTAVGVLAASLVGSVHCAGMCGGFVCFYTGSEPASAGGTGRGTAPRLLHAHALYNVGRLLSYLTLGAIAGAIGARVSELGVLAGVQQGAAIVAGALMVGWALSTLAAQRGVSWGAVRAPLAWQRALGRVLHAVREQPVARRALLTGFFTTLLPCGWLYVFVATAGGSGSVWSAMFLMAVFWLGTVPALVAVGVGAQTILAPFRHRLPLVSATVVLVMGLWSMAGHLRAPSQDTRHVGGSSTIPAAIARPAGTHAH